MQPNYQLIADSVNITDAIKSRLISLSWHDERGAASDTLTLEIDDRPDQQGHYIAMPRKGVVLILLLGYGNDLTPVGKFVVDEVNPSGMPEKLTIKAHAADLQAGLKTKKSRGFDAVTLQDLVTTIAREHGLVAKVSPTLANQVLARISQHEENDMHLLQRLANDRGAVAKITYGFLLFVVKGESKTVSGQLLPVVELNKKDLSSWHGVIADRERYKKVTARYYDKKIAAEVSVHVGSGAPVFTISRLFADDASAKHAAQARFDRQQEGQARLQISTSGQASMVAESTIRIFGMRPSIPIYWICDKAEHTLNKSNGWTVNLDLKQKKAN